MNSQTPLSSVHLFFDGAQAEIFLQGAHLARFDVPSGQVVFLSGQSHFKSGKPIRGGVPLIFPWFGPRKDDANLPAHGFGRTMEWQVENQAENSLALVLESNAATLALWPHAFRLKYLVAFESGKLFLGLKIHNTGESAFQFEAVLHTYFRVSDVRNIEIDGLNGKIYLDQTQKRAPLIQNGPVRIEGETDRIYLGSSGPIILRDGARTVTVSDLGGVKSTVVWNPWIDKARALSDLGDDEWQEFVCIESGVIADDAPTLEAGKCYEMTVGIEVEDGNGENGAVS
jgi:glucose-6-phosphate 1-epimerase